MRKVRFHDFFAGIGGSSTGLVRAGFEGVVALNHWTYAIEVHNENHPDMDHDQADVWTADPRRYKPAEVGWFSPDCAAHSSARGKRRKNELYDTDLWQNPTTDPADNRSRMLMESVPYISERANYRYVLVENVIEVMKWTGMPRWIQEMTNLGYAHRRLCLNSQFFGTPQSRDRIFFVFWKRGMPEPDLEFRPRANCPRCGPVEARQAWKPARYWGKYGQQYIYCCPKCTHEVEPSSPGAETVINWALPAPRIGDRKRPLSAKTIEKIAYGLQRYGGSVMIDTAYGKKARPVAHPLYTQTTQQTLALVMSYYGRSNATSPVQRPMPTVPTENKLALVMAYNGNPVFAMTNEPMPTVTTVERHSLIEAAPAVEDVRFRMLEPRELSDGTGFPLDYKLSGPKKSQVKGIGGAVDSNIAHWIGSRVMEAVR